MVSNELKSINDFRTCLAIIRMDRHNHILLHFLAGNSADHVGLCFEGKEVVDDIIPSLNEWIDKVWKRRNEKHKPTGKISDRSRGDCTEMVQVNWISSESDEVKNDNVKLSPARLGEDFSCLCPSIY